MRENPCLIKPNRLMTEHSSRRGSWISSRRSLVRTRTHAPTGMGVKGLQSYVQNRLPLTDYIVELASLRAGAADAVVVDGMALIRKLYEQSRRLWKSSRPRASANSPSSTPR